VASRIEQVLWPHGWEKKVVAFVGWGPWVIELDFNNFLQAISFYILTKSGF
jgi:hypothetical protein